MFPLLLGVGPITDEGAGLPLPNLVCTNSRKKNSPRPKHHKIVVMIYAQTVMTGKHTVSLKQRAEQSADEH